MYSTPSEGRPLQVKSHCNNVRPTAIVKGGGPSGLAAAITLAQEGFLTKVVEKRPRRPVGEGRMNMVALRPEALRILDQLGALSSLLKAETGYGLTRMVEGKTTNHCAAPDDPFRVFEWPLKRYPPAEPKGEEEQAEKYEIPQKVSEQVPSCFVNLGDLEDCLMEVASSLGVDTVFDGTIDLFPVQQGSAKTYQAALTTDQGKQDLGYPDLIVCASGKGDLTLEKQLNFRRRIGVKLEDESLPSSVRNRYLRIETEHELESQWFSVYGVTMPAAKMGVIDHNIFQHDTEKSKQPVVEIEMRHATASHLLLQIPRGMDIGDTAVLEAYVIKRTNEKLGTKFSTVEDMEAQGCLVWGDPLKPVIVETSTAPTYVFGSNVILIGDAAVSCSPSSGLGAEVGLTLDSQNVRQLAQDFFHVVNGDQKQNLNVESQRRKALDLFNWRKAESAVLWSQGSRMFYLTAEAADDILRQQKE